MVRLKGVEPLAHGLEVRCSIQLSYRRMFLSILAINRKYMYKKEKIQINLDSGAEDEIRTRDFHLGKVTLYH
ncbi:MAG: hypothetical protein K0Q99_1168 [Clostridia bacterium]|nr:hypothetical protein [Clostridia bacterium]